MIKGYHIRLLKRKFLLYLRAFDEWRKQKMTGGNFLIVAAIAVGILSGLAGAALKALTHTIENYLQRLDWDYKYYLFLALPMIGIVLTVLYVKSFIRRSRFEHGLPQLLFSISKKGSKIPFHNIYSQIITSAITVGFGGSVGLEAPIAVSGAAIGSNTGSFLGINYRDRTMLLACGAGAGIAAVFNSPVAGMVLAIELLLPEFSIPAFIPLLISSAVASVVSQLLYSQPLFVLVTEGWSVKAIHFYVLLGIVTGFFSVYFTKLTFIINRYFKQIKKKYNRIWLGGLLLGLLIAIFPVLYGEGYVTIQRILNGNYGSIISGSIFKQYVHSQLAVIVFATFTLFAKSFATLITLGSGGNGGNFGPSLVMGGLIGFIFSYSTNYFFGYHLNVTNFIVVGMAGALSGIMHAPLTGIFLIAEITGGYKLMIPLMIVAALAYYINKRVSKYSIYTKVLADEGNLLTMEDRDRSVLQLMKIEDIVERNYLVLYPHDTIIEKRSEIINSKRNIFPLLNESHQLIGIVQSEQIMELLLSPKQDNYQKLIKEIAQPPQETVELSNNMYDVLQKMERKDLRVLPVLNDNKQKVFIGFITKNAVFTHYRNLLKKQFNYGSNS